MMNYFVDAAFEFEELPIETITLEATHINQAIKLSQKIQSEVRQWQTYLNTLALFGFEEWLTERAPDLPFNRKNSSIFNLHYANTIDAVFNLNIGEFKICLITMGSFTDQVVAVPRAMIDLSEFAAHFYVVMEVIEELAQVNLLGFLRYDYLMQQFQSHPLQAEPNWTYQLPLSWFEDDSNQLLGYLRLLKPEAIALPSPPSQSSVVPPKIEAELETLLPHLQSPDCHWWDVLSWEYGAVLLTHSSLLHRIFGTTQQEPERTHKAKFNPNHRTQCFKPPMVNVGLWLHDEIDEWTRKLSWVLLPAFAPEAVPLRSPIQELEVILKQLERSGNSVPVIARGAYQDLTLAEHSLRLYAITWPRLSPENIPAWTLLLILGVTPGTTLPYGVKLRLNDDNDVLLERTLEPHSEETYLYARVAGTWDEKFNVTLSTTQGTSLTLPPFVFRPNL
jgi:hypothetical protein